MLKHWAILLSAAVACMAQMPPSAKTLAEAAKRAQDHGQIVRAYLLYAEAAERDPQNATYRVNRDGLEPTAKLLSSAGMEPELKADTHDKDQSKRIVNEAAEAAAKEASSPIPLLNATERLAIQKLEPPRHLAPVPATRHSFHLRGTPRSVFEQVVRAWGVNIDFDRDWQPAEHNMRFNLDDARFEDALEAVTAATGTFVFPIARDRLFAALNSQQKRDQLEPQIAVTVPLPDLADNKNTTEAANAVRLAFNLRHIGADPSQRSIVIRDRMSIANPARVLLERLVLPMTEVSLDLQMLTLSENSTLNYGINLPGAFPLINFGQLSKITDLSTLSIPSGFVNFLTFGGGRTLFGIGVTNPTALANLTKSQAKSVYDTTVMVASGQTAQIHMGEKFPIATTLFGSGASNVAGYAAPQIQMVDLGVLLKVKPYLHADGDVSMEVQAQFQGLGTQTFNSVPEILERSFEGSVRLHSGEYAILSGLNGQMETVTRSGIIGLMDIPAVGRLFTQVNKTVQNTQTFFLLKPRPVIAVPPLETNAYFVGGDLGPRVLI